MTKKSGLGSRFFVGGYDLSGDTNALSKMSGGPALIDVSAINGEAFERIGGKRDGSMEFTAIFNDDAGASHAVLSALPTTDVVGIWAQAAAVGAAGAGIVAKQADYPLSRANDGALTANVSLLGNNYGLHFGRMLTPGLRTESAAANGDSFDTLASASFGLTAFIVVTALGSGSPTVKIQDSANDSSFTDVTGATFGVVAAQQNNIIQTAATATVRQYVRVITTGTFSGLSFAVVFKKHAVAVI